MYSEAATLERVARHVRAELRAYTYTIQFANCSFPVSAPELPRLRGEVIVGANLHARLRDHFAAAEDGRGSSRLHHALP